MDRVEKLGSKRILEYKIISLIDFFSIRTPVKHAENSQIISDKSHELLFTCTVICPLCFTNCQLYKLQLLQPSLGLIICFHFCVPS